MAVSTDEGVAPIFFSRLNEANHLHSELKRDRTVKAQREGMKDDG